MAYMYMYTRPENFTPKNFVIREKYLVVLELEMPGAGEVADPDGSTQNPPDKWNWNRILNEGTGLYAYQAKLISSTKVSENVY